MATHITWRRAVDPTTEPVTTAQVKAHLRVTSNSENTVIDLFTSAAREMCEDHVSRAFMAQTWQLAMLGFPAGDEIWLPRPPLLAVSNIIYTDSDGANQTFANTSYHVDTASAPGRVVLDDDANWPDVTDDAAHNVWVTYTAGYHSNASNRDDVPEAIKTAVKIATTHLFEHRGSASEPLPQAVRTLLIPHKVWPFTVA